MEIKLTFRQTNTVLFALKRAADTLNHPEDKERLLKLKEDIFNQVNTIMADRPKHCWFCNSELPNPWPSNYCKPDCANHIRS